MSKKKWLKHFTDLTWRNLEEWAGNRILSRGRGYQREGLVSDLAITEDNGLIAWVKGSKRYTTKVTMAKGGLPVSICTCPYECDCKHGMAVVLEYLERAKAKQHIPKAGKNDERIGIIAAENWDEEADEDDDMLPADKGKDIDAYLKGKTKGQLLEFVRELAQQDPKIAGDLTDRKQLGTGQVKSLVTRLRREIHETGKEPGWRNYWEHEGFTPDYSNIRRKMEMLLKAGHADEVFSQGEELLTIGTRQVSESDDDGETAEEITKCMPTIVRALKQSSLKPVDKMIRAVDMILKDEFDLCETVAKYLMGGHKPTVWSDVSDILLKRLKKYEASEGADTFSRNHDRDELSNWAIHALEHAGRVGEIIPLCEDEVLRTSSYERLVKRLVVAHRYGEAEQWIRKGIESTKEKWPGIADSLRAQLLGIRVRQRNGPVVAAMQVVEFVRQPSAVTFADSKKAADKIGTWTKVREGLLAYLESGIYPWERKDWPLPESGLDLPKRESPGRFPMLEELIDIAVWEQKPEQVLNWYDQLPNKHFGWHGVEEDEIATAVKTHAPDRAVGIWKKMAERSIGRVKPDAYREAAQYLRKAARVINQEQKQTEWSQYLKGLREQHFRKIRLIEILDSLEEKPIVKQRRY